MNLWIRTLSCCIAMTIVLSVALTGCTPVKDVKTSPAAKTKQAHPTKGPRGGSLAEWGEDEYHVEFTVDTAAKSAVVYILAGEFKDGKTVDTKKDPAKISNVKLIINEPKLELDMKYDPQLSGTDKTVFVAMHETFAKAGDYKGSVNATVEGKGFNGDFPLKVE